MYKFIIEKKWKYQPHTWATLPYWLPGYTSLTLTVSQRLISTLPASACCYSTNSFLPSMVMASFTVYCCYLPSDFVQVQNVQRWTSICFSIYHHVWETGGLCGATRVLPLSPWTATSRNSFMEVGTWVNRYRHKAMWWHAKCVFRLVYIHCSNVIRLHV